MPGRVTRSKTRRQLVDQQDVHFTVAGQQQVGLLDLRQELQEAILCLLPQQDLQQTMPLVCKQLGALCSSSKVLWRRYSLELRRVADPEEKLVLLSWLAPRQNAIEDMSIGVYTRGCEETVLSIVLLLRHNLTRLELHTDRYVSFAGDSNSLLLAALNHLYARRLQSLVLRLGHSWLGPLRLPSLQSLVQLQELVWMVSVQPPPGIGALMALTRLEVHNYHGAQPWADAIRSMQRLRRLDLRWSEYDNTAVDLSFLRALPDLEHLALHDTHVAELPAELATLLKLTQLRLDGHDFDEVDSLDQLTALTALRHLHMAFCSLLVLPPQLTALSLLEHLAISHEYDLHMSKAGLEDMLQQLTCLTELHLHKSLKRQLHQKTWAALERKFPRLKLSIDDTQIYF